MRRIWGVTVGTAIAVLLTHAVTDAALAGTGAHRYNFASALMLSVFGETSDANASFFAQSGDRISESPLRELALRVTSPTPEAARQIAYASPADQPAAHISLASLNGDDGTVLSRAASAGLMPSGAFMRTAPGGGVDAVATPIALNDTPTYRPLPAVPNVSPAAGTFAFDGRGMDAQDGAVTPSLKPDAPLTLSGHAPDLSVPAFNSNINPPDVTVNDRGGLNGGASLPLLHGMTLNVNDSGQHPYGDDAGLGVPNLGPTPNLYAGHLTYAIPSLSSTLSISAYQERLGQNVLPPNAYTNNGGAVNFTVKF